jgi:hypothetical protein
MVLESHTASRLGAQYFFSYVLFTNASVSMLAATPAYNLTCPRRISVSVNGTADLVQPHLLSSMHSSKQTLMTLIRMMAARPLQSPCSTTSHSFSAVLRRRKKRKWVIQVLIELPSPPQATDSSHR